MSAIRLPGERRDPEHGLVFIPAPFLDSGVRRSDGAGSTQAFAGVTGQTTRAGGKQHVMVPRSSLHSSPISAIRLPGERRDPEHGLVFIPLHFLDSGVRRSDGAGSTQAFAGVTGQTTRAGGKQHVMVPRSSLHSSPISAIRLPGERRDPEHGLVFIPLHFLDSGVRRSDGANNTAGACKGDGANYKSLKIEQPILPVRSAKFCRNPNPAPK